MFPREKKVLKNCIYKTILLYLLRQFLPFFFFSFLPFFPFCFLMSIFEYVPIQNKYTAYLCSFIFSYFLQGRRVLLMISDRGPSLLRDPRRANFLYFLWILIYENGRGRMGLLYHELMYRSTIHTHTYIYVCIYIFICVCMCVCKNVYVIFGPFCVHHWQKVLFSLDMRIRIQECTWEERKRKREKGERKREWIKERERVEKFHITIIMSKNMNILPSKNKNIFIYYLYSIEFKFLLTVFGNR